MAPPPNYDLGNTLGDVGEFLQDVYDAVEDIRTTVNRFLPWLGPLAGRVRDALESLMDAVGKVFSEIGKVVTQPGVPWTLWSHGDSWLDDVAKEVDKWSQEMTADRVQSDDKWQGEAATKYMESVTAQKLALDQLRPAAKEIQTALRLVAAAIVVFWAAVLVFLAVYVAEMIAAAGGVGSVVGALPGVLLAAAGTAKFWAALIALLAALGTAFTVFQNQLGALKTQLASGVFAAGSWPAATTDNWSDASVNDGDATDWRIKPS